MLCFKENITKKYKKIPHPKHQKPERKIQVAAIWNEGAMEIVTCK